MNKDDIIQITDETHPWFPALMIVDEVRSWGVQAVCIVPRSNVKSGEDGYEPTARAYNRLSTGSFEVVGKAVFVVGTEET